MDYLIVLQKRIHLVLKPFEGAKSPQNNLF